MLDLEIYIIRWYSGDSKYTYETTILQVYYISAVVQSLSCVRLCKSMDCNRPSFPVLYNLLEFAQAHVHWGDDAIQPSHICHLLLLLSLIFLSIKVFSNEPPLHIRWPKYWSFSFCSSNEYSGLISFRIDWFDLPAVQGTCKSLLQHHSLKASVLQCSAFFLTQGIFPRTPNLS